MFFMILAIVMSDCKGINKVNKECIFPHNLFGGSNYVKCMKTKSRT